MTTQKQRFLYFLLILFYTSCTSNKDDSRASIREFNKEKDLLLAQFDCKTDVDDLHSVAAFATLISDARFSEVKYHAVAGAYGIQDGLYVPPNELFAAAFGDRWSDAHTDFEQALKEVASLVISSLENDGDIWIADAGQSDFSAALVRKIKSTKPGIQTSERIHLVQHSHWNEQVTSPESLQFVKEHTDYHKIPDGNTTGNGTPGFRSEEVIMWQNSITDPVLINIWNLAIALGEQYNGKEGRYNNEAIANGGLDFSDLSETCWILGMQHIVDARQFFDQFSGVSNK